MYKFLTTACEASFERIDGGGSRGDMRIKLLAFGILRRYWDHLAPDARQTIAALEVSEEAQERERDPLGDDYVKVMDLLGEYWEAAEGETAMALWLVTGWWPGVKTDSAGQELPASWRPLFDDVFGDAFRPVTFEPAWRTDIVGALARARPPCPRLLGR
jgi:hypothetical protein